MAKIGLTDSDVFGMILADWIAYAAWQGGKVVKSPPHPDVAGNYSALTLSVEFTNSDVRPEPLIKDAICAASNIVRAIGFGRVQNVEESSVMEDEVKYTITIKKPNNNENNK